MSKVAYAVGLDCGYGSVIGVCYKIDMVKKTVERVAQQKFPSRLVQGLNQFQSLMGESVSRSYIVNDVDMFSIGDGQNALSTRFEGYHTSAMFAAFAQHLTQLLFAGRVPMDAEIHVTTGLPISKYYNGSQKNDVLIAEKIQNLLQSSVRSSMDGVIPAKFASVKVMAEGIGAFLNEIANERGDIDRSMADLTISVFDIGGETTDLATFKHITDIDFSRTGSISMGVLSVLQNLQTLIKQRYNFEELDNSRLERLLFDKQYRISGQPLSEDEIKELRDAAIHPVSEQLKNFLASKLKTAHDIDTIYLVGGGATIFEESLKTHFKQIKVPHEPQLANAEGFAKSQVRILMYS